jgi:hypothetical protein
MTIVVESSMVRKEYLSTARTLLRIARNVTDGAIANRLKALADDYERRAQVGEFAESAKGLSPVAVRSDTAARFNSR